MASSETEFKKDVNSFLCCETGGEAKTRKKKGLTTLVALSHYDHRIQLYFYLSE